MRGDAGHGRGIRRDDHRVAARLVLGALLLDRREAARDVLGLAVGLQATVAELARKPDALASQVGRDALVVLALRADHERVVDAGLRLGRRHEAGAREFLEALDVLLRDRFTGCVDVGFVRELVELDVDRDESLARRADPGLVALGASRRSCSSVARFASSCAPIIACVAPDDDLRSDDSTNSTSPLATR